MQKFPVIDRNLSLFHYSITLLVLALVPGVPLQYNNLFLFQGGSLPFSKFEFLVMWMFRECGAPYLFLHALSHPAIRWRQLQFRLRWGGKAEAVPMPKKHKEVLVEAIKLNQQNLPLASSHLIS